MILNTSQPVVANGVVFIGSANGSVHAVELASGKDLWTTQVGAPICHTLACADRRVHAAALDGGIHAFDQQTGAPAWTARISRRGFSAAPLVLNQTLFIGGRDGFFYAVAAADGKILWRVDTGAPIVQSAAATEGRIVFVNEAMRAFCLEAASGKVLWTAGPLPGRTVRDYWPVIHQGKIVIRTAEAGPRVLSGGLEALQRKLFWPVSYSKEPVKDQQVLFKATSVEEIVTEQEMFAEFFRQHPLVRTCIVLNLADGREPCTASVVTGCRNTGVPPPPALAADGNLYTTFRTSAADRGVMDITDCAVGRFDVVTGRIAPPLLCGQARVGDIVGARTPFELTSDETVTLSSGGKLIFGFRCDANGGVVEVGEAKVTRLPDVELPHSADLMPSGNLVVISGRYVLYTKSSHVICIRGR